MPGGLQNIPDAFPLLVSGKVTERASVEGIRPLRAEKMVSLNHDRIEKIVYLSA